MINQTDAPGRRKRARPMWAGLLPVVLLAIITVSDGFKWFWVAWGALLLTGWLPLVFVLHEQGLRRAPIGLGIVGNIWCLPAFLFAGMAPEPAGEVTSRAVGDLLELVLVGGGIGLLLGGFITALLWWRTSRPARLLALPFAASLAGISFYPALAATGVGHLVTQQRYERSGQAAVDATEAARPILSLEEQLRVAGPAMRQAFPTGEIIQISSGSEDARTPRLGVGFFATGRPKQWCLGLREQMGSVMDAPYALSNGDFNPQAFSAAVGDCAGNIGELPTLLRVGQAEQWPWLSPEVAVVRAEASGGRNFRQTRGGALVRLTIRGDTDGRVKWLAMYSAPGPVFEIVMLDAQSGEVLCAEASQAMDSTAQCHWGPAPRPSPFTTQSRTPNPEP